MVFRFDLQTFFGRRRAFEFADMIQNDASAIRRVLSERSNQAPVDGVLEID